MTPTVRAKNMSNNHRGQQKLIIRQEDAMRAKHLNLFATLLLISAGTISSVNAMAGEKGRPAPLIIEEQGSFAVGGTVITNPGTFDRAMPSHRDRNSA